MTRDPRHASQATSAIETAMTSCSTRAANGTVMVAQATTPETTRKAAAESLVPIGGLAAAAAMPVGCLMGHRLDRLGHAGRGRHVERLGRRHAAVVLVQAGARVPPPRRDPGP